MNVLVFSSLYPNSIQHRHGVFVENRTRQFTKNTGNQVTVVAPVPWFPFPHACFGRYGEFNRIPAEETRYDIKVYHPCYPTIPKVGMNFQPMLMYWAAKRFLEQQIENGLTFDVIDVHYFYPDGVVGSWLGEYFKKPVVISARGSDISYIPRYKLPRKMIQKAGNQADRLVAVCEDLKQKMYSLDIKTPIEVLRNGVDLELFRQSENRQKLRQKLGMQGFTLLSVGNIIEIKGHHLVIEALTKLPDTQLVIIGDGPDKANYQRLADSLGVSDRVRFCGNLLQSELVDFYNAADVLTLASKREGCPNVVLESMACGNPVIANDVGGVGELVKSNAVGTLMAERSVAEIVAGVKAHQAAPKKRSEVRAYAEQFCWSQTSASQQLIFDKAINRNSPLTN